MRLVGEELGSLAAAALLGLSPIAGRVQPHLWEAGGAVRRGRGRRPRMLPPCEL